MLEPSNDYVQRVQRRSMFLLSFTDHEVPDQTWRLRSRLGQTFRQVDVRSPGHLEGDISVKARDCQEIEMPANQVDAEQTRFTFCQKHILEHQSQNIDYQPIEGRWRRCDLDSLLGPHIAEDECLGRHIVSNFTRVPADEKSSMYGRVDQKRVSESTAGVACFVLRANARSPAERHICHP